MEDDVKIRMIRFDLFQHRRILFQRRALILFIDKINADQEVARVLFIISILDLLMDILRIVHQRVRKRRVQRHTLQSASDDTDAKSRIFITHFIVCLPDRFRICHRILMRTKQKDTHLQILGVVLAVVPERIFIIALHQLGI